MLTERFDRALAYAVDLHREDQRKGTDIPYIAHLLAVTGTVLEYDGDEDEAIAALLHDAAEDKGGEAKLEDIRTLFGERVARIVADCSDSLAADPKQKSPWKKRKLAYIESLARHPLDSLRVSLSDKVHNARSILRDSRDPGIGTAVWRRFNASRDDVIWYYSALAATFRKTFTEYGLEESRIFQLACELDELVDELRSAPLEGSINELLNQLPEEIRNWVMKRAYARDDFLRRLRDVGVRNFVRFFPEYKEEDEYYRNF